MIGSIPVLGEGDFLAANLLPGTVHSAEDWDEVVIRDCIGTCLQRVGISPKHHLLAQFLLALDLWQTHFFLAA